MLLHEDGYAVSVAYDGRTALGALEGFKRAVVLLDIRLPGMSGLEVARAIRQLSDAPSDGCGGERLGSGRGQGSNGRCWLRFAPSQDSGSRRVTVTLEFIADG